MGLTVAHELLHQGGVAHPTENNASTDVRLNRDNNGGPNDYLTTPNNDPSVLNNIMLYNLYNVNGTNVGDYRKSNNLNGSAATRGQLTKVVKNINLGKVNGEAVE